MKFMFSQLSAFMQQRHASHNLAFLGQFMTMLVVMITVYSVLFHYIMQYEGHTHSWLTGLYWTLTVMSTLGFGDITFTSDLGKLFSIIVLLSGVIFFLVMLPFTFIQYFYAPWLEAQKKRRIPRGLPEGSHGHVILVGNNPLTLSLADDLQHFGTRAIVLCPDSQTTLDMIEQGYDAVMGEHDDGEVYRRMRVEGAAMLVAMDSDVRNTNIVFSAREVDARVPIAAKVEHTASIDILELAGATRVFQFHKLLGEALARRVLSAGRRSSVLTRFEHLVVAEAPLMRTSLVGASLRTSSLRAATGINVVGLWERGTFRLPQPDTVFSANSVIVAAGTSAQIEALDRLLDTGAPEQSAKGPVLILGGGRVGIAAADCMCQRGHACMIVDKNEHLARLNLPFVCGDAAELDVLEQAGLRSAPSVLITTHDDDTNIYLTIYCRRLRPDIQIISRATFDRNIGILHAAGADLVLSLSSMVTNNIINMLSPGKVSMLNEGLSLFRCVAHDVLIGKALSESGIRDRTQCSVVAVRSRDDALRINPGPEYVFQAGDVFYLIGDSSGQQQCYELYGYDSPDENDETVVY